MSSLLADANAALAYVAPDYLPAAVLAVGYGQEAYTPDPIDTIEVAWQYLGRPGMFTIRLIKSGDWRLDMDAAMRMAVFEVESLYALRGGWPPPTPLEAYPQRPPPPGAE